MSKSAPPALNRKNIIASTSNALFHKPERKRVGGTSSFSSPRKTLLPTEYSKSMHTKYSEPCPSVVIDGGAGRKTPITNILEKVTTLDKLWSSEKRNERIDLAKAKSKSLVKPNPTTSKLTTSKSVGSLHKSRDMVRTAEKVQRFRMPNVYTKSNPTLNVNNEAKTAKNSTFQASINSTKSTSNISSSIRKHNNVKIAVVTNLKKKKSLESVVIRPRSVPCHESCSKKSKENLRNTKKTPKSKFSKKVIKLTDSESNSQFGDSSKENSNFGSIENLEKKSINPKEIQETHNAVTSDTFFQHLFFGNSVPIIINPEAEYDTSVLQKAKMFQSFPQNVYAPKSLNSYLLHRKPVSHSRFKMWDSCANKMNAQSPRSISWPGRLHDEIRKFESLKKYNEFGSNSSLATVRSRSEPPSNKIYFSQTSRPISPVVIFHKKENTYVSLNKQISSPLKILPIQTMLSASQKEVQKNIKSDEKEKTSRTHSRHNETLLSPTRIILTETVRPISPTITKWNTEIPYTVKEDEVKCPATIFFSQTSRPVSPKVIKKDRSHSRSPISIRSPSCRRIHSVRLQSGKNNIECSSKKALRTRSAGEIVEKISEHNLLKTQSDTNLSKCDPDYNEYIRDMQDSKLRSERFRELNRYYAYLERVGELEKTTSTYDLRHRKKDEEIIDFDRWKKIRAIERAEEELNNLYNKLKIAQSEKDFLFYPRDVKDFRWSFDKDRGLKIKEKSVEDLKEQFQHPFYSMELDQIPKKDTYKPLWRGTSVAETAFNINRKSDIHKSEFSMKPSMSSQQDYSLTDLRKKIGLGNRLWSSLSMDQVNALKNQLNAIYSKELEFKYNQDNEKYIVHIPDTPHKNKTLHVRSSSLSTHKPEEVKDLSKSESIAAIPCPITSIKELKNNVNKIQMSLSESEKRKISQTLSKEVLHRINNPENTIYCKSDEIQEKNINDELMLPEAPVLCQEEKEHNQRHVVFPISKDNFEPHYQSSASETETGSSDISNKTVIYKGPKQEVKKKVEYFESVKNTKNQNSTIYLAREINGSVKDVPKKSNENIMKNYDIIQSQSCTNIKEMFGESEKNKFLSLPPKPKRISRSPSPNFDVHKLEGDSRVSRTSDILRYSSDETIWRSRSTSPDTERFWKTYFNLARTGEVRRLARRFDSPSSLSSVLRRHRSDPEIARNLLNKSWPSLDGLLTSRDKHKNMLPVVRVPLRSTNRFMPHIDIISKLAALRKRMTPRSRSAEDTLECRRGEVERIRRRFETMSLLGQIYSSAPDVSELRDIAPYLAGPWVAHRYPKRSDNNRSLQNPSHFVEGSTSPTPKNVKRAVIKESVKLSSILKSDELLKQEFDPSVHRPASRYEPARAPPRPPPAAWSYRLGPLVTPSRHTVTFKESESAPEPPRRAPNGSYSDTESPRRYVESDVNIHYRCPVRHDPLPLVPERELARQQAEHMKRLYREQKRNKYLQELQDMQNRRHQDNFTPSQKTIVPLNRYDEAEKIIAKALYTFNGQTTKELSFKKGDILHVKRQIDANWYEGELHGRIGLFPYNYVEIIKGDSTQTIKKPSIVEGRARAKFDFTAQTNLELPLKKGDVVVLSRRIDHNWWEGRNGTKTGIFPDSYVTVLQEPALSKTVSESQAASKPAAAPAAHGLVNGSARRSMGAHAYVPRHNNPALSNSPQPTQPLPGYTAKPAQAHLSASERGYGPPTAPGVDLNNTEPLYVDTNAEAVPYRAMYKYRPQNPDELELSEGDTVYVLERCDDGWYVGSSQRTGRFGTFPGNYVERI